MCNLFKDNVGERHSKDQEEDLFCQYNVKILFQFKANELTCRLLDNYHLPLMYVLSGANFQIWSIINGAEWCTNDEIRYGGYLNCQKKRGKVDL